ncbi:hypothetical protein J6590_026444 [Homalodisca vitripennis]|nr:hypothetical protein J6590_026444 [Homalodisca vitripennis]
MVIAQLIPPPPTPGIKIHVLASSSVPGRKWSNERNGPKTSSNDKKILKSSLMKKVTRVWRHVDKLQWAHTLAITGRSCRLQQTLRLIT